MAGSGIPARGPGNGNPSKPFTAENAAEIGARGGHTRAKMRKWREEHPDAPLTMNERDRLIRQALRECTPDVLDAMIAVASDPEHKDFAPTARVLLEHDLGKPKQSVSLSGETSLNLIVTQQDLGLL